VGKHNGELPGVRQARAETFFKMLCGFLPTDWGFIAIWHCARTEIMPLARAL